MAVERKWEAVPAQSILQDGDDTGYLSVPDSSLFHTKQKVKLFSDTVSPIEYQVKRVVPGFIALGDPKTPLDRYDVLTNFKVADNAKVLAEEQDRPSIIPDAYNRAMFEEEPVVAQRSILVDKFGRKFSDSNPIPTRSVDAVSGDLELRFDQVSPVLMYLAEAPIGSLESEAKWKIRKIEVIGTGISIKYASSEFNQIWDNRGDLTYV